LKISFDWWEDEAEAEILLNGNGLGAFTGLSWLYVLDITDPDVAWMTKCTGSLARRVIHYLTKVFQDLTSSGVECSVPQVVILRRQKRGAGSHGMRELTDMELLADAEDDH
jgi:hypothetical protein